MADPTSSGSKRVWTYGLVLVSVVALAVVVVGLLLPTREPELTTAPPTSTAESEAVTPAPPDVVNEPVDPTAPIPGCATVEEQGETTSASFVSMGEPSYDNPRFPWFSAAKATAMSNAVAELLPTGAEIEFASPSSSLVFQPITDFGESTPNPPPGSTHAGASVTNGDAKGGVNVSVQQTPASIPPCVAGYLDERRTLPGAVVADIHDTWQDVNGVRTLRRSVTAYVPDGSWISASADDSSGATGDEHSGKIPLTVDDLVRIVSDPRLRVSTAAPPGTPAPSQACNVSFGADGPAVTREQARRLDAVLADIDFGGVKPGPLRPGGPPNDTLCTSVPPSCSVAALDITITGGQPPPVEERPSPGSGVQTTLRTLADGTVVQSRRDFYSVAPMDNPEQTTMEMSNSVVVTRPSGTRVSVSSSAAPPTEARPLNVLESIALAPGLEL